MSKKRILTSRLRGAALGLLLLGLLAPMLGSAATPPPSITVQPASQTVPFQGTVTFSVTVNSGTSVSYQWYKNGASISGATLNSYTIFNVQASDQATYTVKVTNLGGNVTSSGAVLTVLLPPTITTQPLSQAVALGGSVSFSVAASGWTPFTCQWSFNGTALPGATSATLTLNNVQTTNAGSYTVVVANSLGSATSAGATLTVYVPPTITTQPQSQAVTLGQPISFSVAASGTGPFTYQWYLNGAAVGGAEGQRQTYTHTSAGTSDAGNYTVLVANSAGSVTSAAATLTVYVPPSISGQPSSASAVQGQTVSFSVTGSGSPPPSYQWNVNGINLTDGPFISYFAGATNVTYVSGSAAATLTLSNVQPALAGNVYVVLTNLGGTLTSSIKTLTVYVPATITNQPTSLMVTQGQTASFFVGAVGTATVKYQWGFNGASLGSGSGAQTAMLTLSNVGTNNAGSYGVVVYNSYGIVTSAVVTLTVLAPAQIATQPLSQAVILGQNASFSVVPNGSGPFTYQWYFNGVSLGGGSGAQTATLTVGNAGTGNAGNYTVVVRGPGGTVTSAAAMLTVWVPVGIQTQPSNQAVVQGQSTTFSVVAKGTAPYGYQWYLNGTMLTDGPNISGSTGNLLTLSNVQSSQAGSIYVVITNVAGSVTSGTRTLTVNVPAGIATQPPSQIVIQGQSPTLTVVASGTPNFQYQWYLNGTAITYGPGPGATSSSLTITNAQTSDSGNYTVVVNNNWGTVTSAVAVVTVVVSAGIQTQPANQTVAQGQTANFSVVAKGTSPFSYQWYFNGSSLLGGTAATLTLPNAQAANAGSYYVVITNLGGSVTSQTKTLTVNGPPVITAQPQSQTLVWGQSASFTVGAIGTATLTCQWYFNGASLGSGARSATLTVSSTGTNNVGNYTVVVTNAYGAVTSSVATLTAVAPAVVMTHPVSQTVTLGSNATLSVVASGAAPLSYQWQYSGVNIAGATNSTFVRTNVQLVQAGNYSVTVANPWSFATSTNAFLTVAVPAGTDSPTMRGLVVHLSFDADFTDSSGRGNHAAAVGAPNLVPGFIGAQAFNPYTQNGTNNYATLGTPSDLSFGTTNDFSIAFWARLPTNAWSGSSYFEPPFIANKNFATYANVGWTIATGPGGRFEWNYSEGTAVNYFGPAGTFGNPTWHHLAVTFHRGGSGVAYVDGVAVSTNSIAPGGQTIDPSLPTNIGNDGTGAYPAAYGYFTNVLNIPTNGLAMDDLGIWRRALLPTEIGAIYNAGAAGQDLSTVTAANLTTTVLPRITQQPVSFAADAGMLATFSITASGPSPFGYQWYGQGGRIAGANGAVLSLTNVQPASAGSYYVVLTNATASLTSAVVALTVNAPASITTPPQSQSVVQGANVAFSVVAGGAPTLVYKWCFNGVALAGAGSSTLVLTNVQDANAGNYAVVVTNAFGSVTSTVAALTVLVPPAIVAQPQSQSAVLSRNVAFSPTATGTAPLSYQWSFNGTDLAGATNSALSLTSVQPTDAGSYRVVVANSAGSVTSAAATLTVLVPPAITAPPPSQTLMAGQSALFSVAASGTAPLSYQWSFNGTDLAGATSSALSLTSVQPTDAGSYRVVVANSAGSVTSAVALLTVTNPAPITPPSLDGTAMTSTGFSFQLSVPAGRTYIIQASTNLRDWTPIYTNVSLTGSVVLTDPSAANYSQRFYRAMMLP